MNTYIATTTRYLHLARPGVPDGARREPLNLLAALPPAQQSARQSVPAPTQTAAAGPTPAH